MARLFGRIPPVIAALCVARAARAASAFPSPAALKQMSLDELLAIQVTSVSKSAEDYGAAAAALTVLTTEKIERSGATTLPEALRLVPGLHVARRNASSWAVSARGFSSTNSEKLLVLSDTRSLYTPLFSGVGWDVQDMLLHDIERIEVIRGPGAALWGSNAVNGVINITTKHAADTHGTYAALTAGTSERAALAARYGSETPGGVHYRVFAQAAERDETFNTSVRSDDWRMAHAGFRADWGSSADGEYTLQGDVYGGTVGQLGPATSIVGRPEPTGDLEARVAGGNILGRWRRTLADGAELQLRAYYDHTHRNDPTFIDDLHAIDFDVQHRSAPVDGHEFLWGLNFHHTSHHNRGKIVFALDPPKSSDQVVSAFVQDQFSWSDSVDVTLGTKLEKNDFSGFEWQPSARAVWQIAGGHSAWAAVSRAARSPTRLERDIAIDVTDPAGDPIVRLLGNDDFAAEDLVAYELGYRWRATESVHVDVALFANRYKRLASLEFADPFLDPVDGRTVIPIIYDNRNDGRAQGGETALTWTATPRWSWTVSHSYLDLSIDPGGADLNRGEFYEGATPRHQFGASTSITLSDNLQFDAHFRHIGRVRRFPEDASGNGIPAYSELDVRLAWQASERIRLSLVGQNLLHSRHIEFGSPATRGSIRRAAYARIEWEM